jgi:hypothetical protein
MNNIYTTSAILSITFILLFCGDIYSQEIGDTRIAYWKDDKAAVFSLSCDDRIH